MKEKDEKIEKDEEDNGLAIGMSLGMSIGIAIGSVSKKDEKK